MVEEAASAAPNVASTPARIVIARNLNRIRSPCGAISAELNASGKENAGARAYHSREFRNENGGTMAAVNVAGNRLFRQSRFDQLIDGNGDADD